jgi:hypothetical protein
MLRGYIQINADFILKLNLSIQTAIKIDLILLLTARPPKIARQGQTIAGGLSPQNTILLINDHHPRIRQKKKVDID